MRRNTHSVREYCEELILYVVHWLLERVYVLAVFKTEDLLKMLPQKS